MDYSVRRHQKTGRNKIKIWVVDKNQQEQRTISLESTACSKYLCSTEPMSWKSLNINWENTLWSWPIWLNCGQGTIAEKANNVKRFQWALAHKHWTREQWIKELWTDESKFKIFGSYRRVYVLPRVQERVSTFFITPTVKHGGGSVGF